MSWARFDDRAPHHRKVKRLSDSAFRLWFTSICHCAEYLTNGRIDAADVADMPKAPTGKKLAAAIAELVEAGCWDEVEGGWEVHDYLDWNPTADEVKAKREARAEAGRRGGQSSGRSRSKNEAIASTEAKQPESKTESKTNPVPVPVPVPEPKAAEAIPRTSEAVAPDEASKAAAAAEPSDLDFYSLEKCLRFDAQPRAKAAISFFGRNSQLSTWCTPEQWPEVRDLAQRFAESIGCPGTLGTYRSDAGVRTLVELLAMFTASELSQAVERAKTDEFVSSRGLSALSPEVVRRLVQGVRPKARERPGFARRETVQPNHGVNPFALVPQE